MTSIKKEEFYFPSSNGIDEIYVISFIPRTNAKGYIQFVHDKYEHISHYHQSMEKMAREGYIVFGHDHIGHGKSVKTKEKLGQLNGNDVFINLITDTHLAFAHVFNKFPVIQNEKHAMQTPSIDDYKNIPIRAMIGIGFGSAIIKNYSIMYDDVNCVVLCGDNGFSLLNQLTIMKCKRYIKKYGEMHYSDELIKDIEKKYLVNKDSNYRFSYRTSNQKALSEYKEDELCQFEYNLKSLYEILRIENSMKMQEWVEAYPLFLTTYIISGKKDPINNNTKALEKLIYYIKQYGQKNIFYKYYDGYHNLFFEKNYLTVLNDILTIINAVRNQQYKRD